MAALQFLRQKTLRKRKVLVLVIFFFCKLRWAATESCSNIQVFDKKKLDMEPYIQENVTDLFECYLNSRADGKCISLNYSQKKSICQRLRRSHKLPTTHSLVDDTDWAYFINPENPCNQEAYPCAWDEFCQRRRKQNGEESFCTYKDFDIPVNHKGCFRDAHPSRAIDGMEGKDDILDGDHTTRKNPVQKCYQAAKNKGYQVFAVQDGGYCHSSPTAHTTYSKYGHSDACEGGEGGWLANDVYWIRE